MTPMESNFYRLFWRVIFGTKRKTPTPRMTPTESNFYTNGCNPFRIKIFRIVLACVFGTKTMTKQNRQLKYKFFFYQIPNPSEILNVYWHSER